MKKTRNKLKITGLVLTLVMMVSLLGMFSLTASAAAAADLTVTIDTGASVTLKDADGDGYYDIGTADELYAFAALAEAQNHQNVELTNNIIVNDVTFTYADDTLTVTDKEGNPVDVSTLRPWTPIGKNQSFLYTYAKTVEGNGFYISGLYCDATTQDNGLFACAGQSNESANIKNLGIVNSFFGGKQGQTAAFIGVSGEVNIQNCYSSAIVVGDYYSGGFVGRAQASNILTIGNSYYFGTVVNKYDGGVLTSEYHHDQSIYNSYYLEGCAQFTNNDSAIAVTAEQIASGEVAYLLQQGVQPEDIYDEDWNWIGSEIPAVWGQTIGTDAYPVFATEDNIVYESILCDDSIGYSNSQSEEVLHADLNDHGYCSICQIKITGASITVGKDLTMNYYVSLIDPNLLGEGQSLTMRFTMGGKTFTATEYTPENGEYIFAFTGIAPQQMSDNILAELLIGEDVIASKDHYSVKANAEALLELYKDDEYLVQFVTDMLYYGAAAQNYKDYNVEDLANADVTGLGTPSTALPEKTDLDLTESASQSLYFVSATVWFDNVNKIGVRLSTLENASLKVNGVEVELTDVLYYTEGISATDFDKIYTFELYENGELVQTLKYSVNSYAYSKQSSENQTMRDLAISLYRYGASAEIYRHIASNEAHVFENGVCSICGIATYTYDESTNTYSAYTEEGLHEAVAGAMATGTEESPATIVVMADMEVNDPDPSDDGMYGNNGITLTAGVVILDLNGHTLTSTVEDALISVANGARLTIRDSSASQSGKMINSNYVLDVVNSAELIVDGGSFESQEGDTVYLVNWGSLTVNGGTFTSLKMSAVYTYENITVNGGSFVGAEYAVSVGASGANVTLNGGSFTGGTADLSVYDSSSAVMNYAEDGNGACFAGGLSIKCWSSNATATLGELLADGAGYFDADGKQITTGLGGMSIEGDVTVKKIN